MDKRHQYALSGGKRVLFYENGPLHHVVKGPGLQALLYAVRVPDKPTRGVLRQVQAGQHSQHGNLFLCPEYHRT